MNIQLAFDAVDFDTAIHIAHETADLLDVIELGTPFLFSHSLSALKSFREVLPDKCLMADMKIVDGGRGMAELAFSSGADMVSVSGRTWPQTICETIEVARLFSKHVLVDFEGTPTGELGSLIRTVNTLTPDYICIHRRFGAQDDVAEEMRIARENAVCGIALAGGIGMETVASLGSKGLLPDLLVVGKAIMRASSPRKAILQLRAASEV